MLKMPLNLVIENHKITGAIIILQKVKIDKLKIFPKIYQNITQVRSELAGWCRLPCKSTSGGRSLFKIVDSRIKNPVISRTIPGKFSDVALYFNHIWLSRKSRSGKLKKFFHEVRNFETGK